MRMDESSFGTVEVRLAPEPVSGETVLRCGLEKEQWLRDVGGPQQDDLVRSNGIKRVSCLYRLPYWKVCLRPELISIEYILYLWTYQVL